MRRKIVGSFAHAKHTWIVETVRTGDVRTIRCGRCVVTALLYPARQKVVARRQQFVKKHSQCRKGK